LVQTLASLQSLIKKGQVSRTIHMHWGGLKETYIGNNQTDKRRGISDSQPDHLKRRHGQKSDEHSHEFSPGATEPDWVKLPERYLTDRKGELNEGHKKNNKKKKELEFVLLKTAGITQPDKSWNGTNGCAI